MWMRLEDICTVFTDGDWIESKDQADEGIRLIQTGNIGMGAYLEKEEKAKYISSNRININHANWNLHFPFLYFHSYCSLHL